MKTLQTKSIDFSVIQYAAKENEALQQQRAGFILAEIARTNSMPAADDDNEIACRGSYRWVKTIEKLTLETSPSSPLHDSATLPSRLKKAGVYLVTGGFGGIGRVLAQYLAGHCQARLILTGRSTLPERASWDEWLAQHDENDSLSEKIRFVRSLEKSGAEVIASSCDVTDKASMRELIQQAGQQFGEINGVIHAAGVPGGGLIQLKTRQSAETILAPKVQGARVLDELFGTDSLDFMLFCSSLAAITGGIGQVDYSAANSFLDTLALKRQQQGLYTVSVNWDTWGETGMAVEAQVPAAFEAKKQANLQSAIRSEEGVDVFLRVLKLQLPQLIISTRENLNRVAEVFDTQTTDQSAGKTATTDTGRDGALAEDYAPPHDATQSALCDIWQEMFGIEKISVNDSFFDLGGHSLLAIQILSRVNESLGCNISLNAFFDAATISKLSEQIKQSAADGAQDITESTALTDDMVDAMSDEEVARLLAEKGVEL